MSGVCHLAIAEKRNRLGSEANRDSDEEHTDPFVKDVGPLLGRPPVEQHPRLLSGLVYGKVLVDHFI